ncbi:MAG: YraN family protein [Flavobacteriaceae bacterium]|jgi:putative endonuclease|nr:YraN family protein [Flavobacteriaceae bacterium]MDG1309873.1 YraN family protein [Flavobacteriaceae bacterium]|tara:strand:+ start:7628 stop:7987 length:360 start_codon:yes stop_codon:yes gene_type:complete
MSEAYIRGISGERMAVDYLISKGYRILAQNFRYMKGEVDILAQKEKCLAAVEVKTRSTSDFGAPEEFLKPAQIQRIIKTVDYFVTSKNLEVEVRFDIIAIVISSKNSELEHIENAFYHF